MTSENQKVSFQKAWHIEVAGLKMLDFASDHHSFVTCDKDSLLRLFNHQGQELWHRSAGFELVSVSLADTLEVLTVDAEKHSMLFGAEGATLWRKRPFPALIGKISASGDSFAFVTTDPAIVGADRSLRVKWAYRNLMKRPAGIALSSLGQTTAFPCSDDRGEGLSAVNQTGKPYDAFMGLDTILDVDLSLDGQIALAIAANGRTFCLNVVKGHGIWKIAPGAGFIGVSYASATGESLVYSASGQVIKLNEKGESVWEHWFPDRLLKVSITADGNSIFYATERGEIGLLTQAAGQLSNKMTFQEVAVRPMAPGTAASFRKAWSIELAGTSEHQSAVAPWKGQDGVEYCLVWDGIENLFCLNDIGEEVWHNRLNGSEVLALSVSPEADTAVAVTSSGVAGFDLSGYESFKFFGQFSAVHVFDDGAMILLDDQKKCRFYQSSDHYSHIVEIDGEAAEFFRYGEKVIIRSASALHFVDATGTPENSLNFDHQLTFAALARDDEFILCGTADGRITVYDQSLAEVFSYNISGPVRLVSYHKEHEAVFACADNDDVVILKRRTGEMMRTTLTGRPVFITWHESGAVVGTDLDQLGLINPEGQILARYTSPYRLKKLLPCHRRMCMIVLADEAVSCVAAVDSAGSTGQ